MILFTSKISLLLLIQVSVILNLVQAACDAACKVCGSDGVSCEECSVGYGLSDSPPTCVLCPAGYYGPPGRYAGEGSIACRRCAAGADSLVGFAWCQPCLNGQNSLSVSGSSCQICPKGFATVGYTGCEACLPGEYVHPDFSVCMPCLAGTFSKNSSFQCDICPAGHYSGGSAVECSTCPAGSIPESNEGPCVLCEPGLWSNPGDSECFCPAGTVLDQGTCVPCGPNLWSNFGDSECSPCPPGSVLDIDQGGCVACGAGLWADLGDSECWPCREGSILDTAQGSCVPCGTGLWADSGDSECLSCGPNCEACESSTTCAKCKYPTENRGGTCVLECPLGQFASSRGCIGNCFDYSAKANCVGCSANCQECKSKSECTVCKPDYIRQLDPKTLSYTCSPKPMNTEKAATKSTAVGLGATSTVAKAMSSGSSGALGFGVVAKVIRNVRYFNIKYSNKTQETFAAEGSSSFEIHAPSCFDETETKELHGNFVKYDVEPNFLINYWGNLIPILILSGCFVILKILKRYLGQSKKRKILTNKVVMMFQVTAGNYLVNSLYGSFDEIVLYFILEAQTCTFDSVFSWMSFICALIFLIIGIGFFGFHFYILKGYQAAKSNGGAQDQEKKEEKRLEAFKAQHAYVKVLFEDFKDESLAQQSFLASFMIRASLLNVLLCLFVNHPVVEACLYLAVNLFFAILLVIKRPYEKLKGAAAQYFCEAIILITYSCALILTIMDHNGAYAKSSRELLEKIIVVLGIGLNVGGTVFQCLDILIEVCLYIKSFKIWRARLRIASAPVGAVSMAADNHVDLTFMKAKTGLKIHPIPEDGDLVSRADSPTRLISMGLDTEIERVGLPSINSTRKPSIIVFTGGSQDDLDYYKRIGTGVFELTPPSEMRIEERSNRNISTSSSIRKSSTRIFTGESHNDLDYYKRTGVFEIPPVQSETKREERGDRKIIVSSPEQVEEGGETFGDIIVFDYEKVSQSK